MNRKNSVFFITFLLMCTAIFGTIEYSSGTASALPSDNNFTFEFINGGTAVKVVTWQGTSPNAVIPSTLSGLPVVCIGERAFYFNGYYTSVSIPTTITTIETEAFRECTALTAISIPNSVTSIGAGAFWGCTALASVNMGSGVAALGNNTFNDCTTLTSITFPVSLESIGAAPMRGCSALTTINVAEANPAYASVGGVLYNKPLSTLIQYPGGGASAFTVPGSVTAIGTSAFEDCTALTSVTLPSGLVHIGEAAFQQCIGLTSVTIPSGVTTMGARAFQSCTSLTSFAVPASLTSIGGASLQLCSSLTSINAAPSNPSYASVDGVLYDKTVATLHAYPAGKTGAFTVPSSVTTIDVGAFASCDHLTSVTIGDGVTSLGLGAFDECLSLNSVTIGDGVTTIAPVTFFGCTALTSVTFGDGLTSIDSISFFRCTALTAITIPGSVTSIGDDAFHFCSNLASITFAGDAPTVGSAWVAGTSSALAIYYYEGAAGFTTPTWNDLPCTPLEPTPSAPTGLMATAGHGTVHLSWSPPVNLGKGTIDYYIVYQNGVDIGHVAGTSTTISGLSDGQSYSFKVSAHNGYGIGTESDVVAATPAVLPTVSITSPSNNSYSTTGTVVVAWSAAKGSLEIARVEVSTDGSSWNVATGSSRSFSLTDGTRTIYVKVTDTAGNSATAAVTINVDTVAPQVTAKSPNGTNVSTGTAIDVTFSEAMDHSTVSIAVGSVSGAVSWNGNQATFTPSKALLGNTTYTVTVAGSDLAGNALSPVSWTFTTGSAQNTGGNGSTPGTSGTMDITVLGVIGAVVAVLLVGIVLLMKKRKA